MCGRYYLNATPADLATHFEVDVRDNFPPRYNIAPTQPIAVIHRSERRERAYALMRWGFIPSWARGEHLVRFGSKPLINARSETAADKPAFRNAYRRRRCLVPADGFYEWSGRGAAKKPYAVSCGRLFAFAALWETAIGPDGGEADTVAILTSPAGPDLSSLHPREPVVISPEHYEAWVDGDERDAPALASLLRPRAEGSWTFHAVSDAVGNVRHDGPQLLARTTLF